MFDTPYAGIYAAEHAFVSAATFFEASLFKIHAALLEIVKCAFCYWKKLLMHTDVLQYDL